MLQSYIHIGLILTPTKDEGFCICKSQDRLEHFFAATEMQRLPSVIINWDDSKAGNGNYASDCLSDSAACILCGLGLRVCRL